MSERILKALMQLFAIIARVDGITNSGRAIVELFLKQQLNSEQVEEYLKLFDEFLDAHHNVSAKKEGARKRTSLNSVKILKICTQINSELAQKQKVVVLLRLLEFIYSNDDITEQELEFVATVADTFNIEEEEFKRCLAFTKSRNGEVPNSSKVLIINNQKSNNLDRTKHICNETLHGQIQILHIPSVGMYALSYNGHMDLYLNAQAILPGRIYILTQGASIRSSKVNPIYYSDIISAFLSDTSKAKVTFTADHIQFKFKSGKIGLHELKMHEESGKMIGIMGGSGAGKSTLLNVLNGNEKPTSGQVLINGYDIHNEKDKIEGVIGYVSQDDLLIEELTVFQNLFYNAKLCFDHLSDNEIAKKVIDVLNDLGLYETKDLKVGSPLEKTISGGQRKRLNIGLELIRQPTVMFVDEPTSGLSSRDSENIMDLLKELSLKGKLIFVVIHQPSSDIFKMFDKLMILDLGGYPIYYGNPVDGVIYFKQLVNHVNAEESECYTCGNVNPEQIFNIIESKVVDEYGNPTRNRKVAPKEWNEYYKSKLEQQVPGKVEASELPEISFKVPNKFKQFKVFITRDVLSKLTNKQYLAINLLEAPLLAFILAYLIRYFNTDVSNTIGYIYRENENIPAYLFMSVVVALFIGLTVSAEEIIRDRKILKRESFLNLSRISYLFSKIAIMFFLSAIQTISFILVGNLILGVKGMTMDYWMILFTTSCFANMLGLNISSAFNSAVTIYILIPFLIIPQLLLSGVIVKFDKLNPIIAAENTVPIAGEIMASRWAFEALSVNQFKSNKYERKFYKYDKIMSNAGYKKDFWIPKIREKINSCESNFNKPEMRAQFEGDVALLRNELGIEKEVNTEVEMNFLDKLTTEQFNNAEVFAYAKTYVDKLQKHYIRQYNKASDDRDNLISKYNKTPEDKEKFIALKNNYENDNLSDLVKNKNEFNKILEKNNELIQRADPVFLDPVKSTGVRSHFFAPRKKVFGKYIDTFWVNIMVIWSMSLGLAIILYFDLLKKLLDSLEKLASRFSKKSF